jgi:hypothetical protein
MKGWWIALLLAATGAQAQAPRDPPSVPDEVAWPLPWVAGRTLVYADSYRQVSLHDGQETSLHGTSTTYVDGVRHGDGYRQRWRSEGMAFKVRGMETAVAGFDMQAVMAEAARAFEGVVIEVDLDAGGAYDRIANLDALVTIMRGMLRSMFDEMSRGLVANGMPAAQWQAVADAILGQVANRDTLAGTLAEAPVAYNFMARGGLVPGQTHAFTDEGVLPLGGAPVARNHQLRVVPAPSAPGRYDVRWTVELDRHAVRDAVVASVDAMFASIPELKGTSAEALADGIQVATTVEYRIDGATGIVERMRRTTNKSFAGRKDTEVAEMVLREVRAE